MFYINHRNATRGRFTAKERTELIGVRYPLEEVIRAAMRLHDQLGQDLKEDFEGYYSEGGYYQLFEEVLHELAHHVALEGVAKFEKREESIGNTINMMSPGAADGNELDALAIEFVAAWWLGWPLNQKKLVRAAANGNLNYLSGSAERVVSRLMRDHRILRLGLDLAVAVRDERKEDDASHQDGVSWAACEVGGACGRAP